MGSSTGGVPMLTVTVPGAPAPWMSDAGNWNVTVAGPEPLSVRGAEQMPGGLSIVTASLGSDGEPTRVQSVVFVALVDVVERLTVLLPPTPRLTLESLAVGAGSLPTTKAAGGGVIFCAVPVWVKKPPVASTSDVAPPKASGGSAG